jgi:hypothetical protein
VPADASGPAASGFPGSAYELAGYANKIRTLGILWIAYAGISLIVGFAGLAFARAFLAHGDGGWMHSPLGSNWGMPLWLHFAWIILSLRAVLYVVTGWGLLQRAPWGRVMAIVVAILTLLKFPFGTALGVASLILLLGYRNTSLYQQL